MPTAPIPRMDLPEALKLLRKCFAEAGVRQTKHFIAELAKEARTFVDVGVVIGSGNIYDAPEQDLKSGDWKYKVEGFCRDRQWLAIVFCFKEVDLALLIPVFSVENLRR